MRVQKTNRQPCKEFVIRIGILTRSSGRENDIENESSTTGEKNEKPSDHQTLHRINRKRENDRSTRNGLTVKKSQIYFNDC